MNKILFTKGKSYTADEFLNEPKVKDILRPGNDSIPSSIRITVFYHMFGFVKNEFGGYSYTKAVCLKSKIINKGLYKPAGSVGPLVGKFSEYTPKTIHKMFDDIIDKKTLTYNRIFGNEVEKDIEIAGVTIEAVE